jgi:hypothetical protein
MTGQFGAIVFVLLAAGACSSAGAPPLKPSGPSGQVHESSAVANNPLDVVDFWKQNPELAPDGIEDDAVLTNVRGKGARVLKAPGMIKFSKLLMVLTCVGTHEYVVQAGTAEDPSWTWTKGASCGGPNIHLATSPTLSSTDPLSQIYVMVDPNVDYRLVLYGIP